MAWYIVPHGLKLNIQKTKIMASGPITLWQIDGETVETVADFILLGSKITADGDCSHEIKRHLLLGRKVMTNLEWLHFHFSLSFTGEGNGNPLQCSCLENPRDGGAWWAAVYGVAQSWTRLKWLSSSIRQHIKKQRNYFVNKGLPSQGYGFSSSHLWMWELGHNEGWVLRNWCFQIVVLEKTLESPLDSKEIKPINPKGSQSWIFIGRTDAEADIPILWPPDGKSWLIEKDPDAGKDWRQQEKRVVEDDMIRWHHQLSGYEFEQTLGDMKDTGTWRAAVHGISKSQTRLSTWTELKWLDSEEIRPVNPKGNQPWIFIGRTDDKAEAPILWPPDTKTLLIGKDLDTGKYWGQEEKGWQKVK